MDRVIFIPELSKTSGYGHFFRLIALSEYLVGNNFTIEFVLDESDLFLLTTLTKHGYNHTSSIDVENDLKGNEIVVLDGYSFSLSFQRQIKSKGSKLICIDDFQHADYAADVIINHAFQKLITDVDGALYTQFKLGLKHILVRPIFRKSTRKNLPKINNALFICFGGADLNDLTGRLVIELIKNKKENIHILISNNYGNEKKLRSLSRKIKIYQNLSAEELIAVIRLSTIAIVPASTLSYECASVGVGMIIVKTVDNQGNIFNTFRELNLARCVENPDVNKIVSSLSSYFPDEIKKKLENQRKHFVPVDNQFLKIFNNLMSEYDYSLISAEGKDAKLYFNWANDELVRENSLDSEKIPWATHKKWFSDKLKDSNWCLLKLKNMENKAVGQVRLAFDDECILINYSIDGQFRNLGLGRIIIKKSMEKIEKEFGEKEYVKAIVKNQNTPSIQLFKDFRFSVVEEKNEITTFRKEIRK